MSLSAWSLRLNDGMFWLPCRGMPQGFVLRILSNSLVILENAKGSQAIPAPVGDGFR
jgi:hypothetical protein